MIDEKYNMFQIIFLFFLNKQINIFFKFQLFIINIYDLKNIYLNEKNK